MYRKEFVTKCITNISLLECYSMVLRRRRWLPRTRFLLNPGWRQTLLDGCLVYLASGFRRITESAIRRMRWWLALYYCITWYGSWLEYGMTREMTWKVNKRDIIGVDKVECIKCVVRACVRLLSLSLSHRAIKWANGNATT